MMDITEWTIQNKRDFPHFFEDFTLSSSKDIFYPSLDWSMLVGNIYLFFN